MKCIRAIKEATARPGFDVVEIVGKRWKRTTTDEEIMGKLRMDHAVEVMTGIYQVVNAESRPREQGCLQPLHQVMPH